MGYLYYAGVCCVRCRKMTRPMTGQPKADDELTNATQKANAELSKMLENGDIERGFNDNDEEQACEKTDDQKLEELREFKENNDDLYEDNGKGGQQIAVSDENGDEITMEVTEDGETQEFTRDEWDARRDTRTRTWERLARDGGMYVRVPRWLNDTDVNKVTSGRGFYGHKVGETDKAIKLEVQTDSTHTAEAETVWVPKSVVRTYELQ